MAEIIALVDDDRNILDLGLDGAGSRRVKVHTYADGDEALRGLTARRPTWPCSTSRCRAWTAWSC